MGFKLYKKETVKFKVDGCDIEMDVNRLSAKEGMQYAMKSSRSQDLLKSEDHEVVMTATMDSFQMQIDLLAEIITDIRGIDDLDGWPEDQEERKAVLGSSNEFLMAAVTAYSAHGKAPANSTPKQVKEAAKAKEKK
jgi:hypothetical protein